MSPFGVPEGIAAGAALLGLGGQVHANAQNVKLAREQMRFQERMSSTAVQRHRADLERAGYNPMLGVAGAGAGASTPSGASPRVENVAGSGITSGAGAARTLAEIKLLGAQTEKTKVEGMKTQQELADLQANPDSPVPQQASYSAQQRARGLRLNADTLEAVLPLVAKYMSAQIARELNSAIQARDHASLLRAQTILTEFEQQHAKNLSDAEKSLYFRRVAPYVHSAGEVVGIAGRVATPVAIGRGARAIQRGPLGSRRTGGVIHPDLPVGTLIRDTKTGKVIGRSR